MNARWKICIRRLLEQAVPFVLILLCIPVMLNNKSQPRMPHPLQVNFAGEYSVDGGESWAELTQHSDLTASGGSVILRGNFDHALQAESCLYAYRDHIGIEVYVNGKSVYLSCQTEVRRISEEYHRMMFPYVCSRGWECIGFPEGVDVDDVVEIHLVGMHKFGGAESNRAFLETLYAAPMDPTIMEEYLQPYALPGLIFGGLLLIVAVMVMGAALLSIVKQPGLAGGMSQISFLLMFAGGFIILDTVTVSFWNENRIFETYGWQICAMLATYWLGLCCRDILTGVRKKAATILQHISVLLNAALLVPAFIGLLAEYDTKVVWAGAQILFSAALFGACVWELLLKTAKDRPALYASLLMQAAVLADIAGVGSGVYSHATCSKVVFAVQFILYELSAIKNMLSNYQSSQKVKRLEKKLEDSRIAIMLSQLQPHFLYNILNVIYYLCAKDPQTAQSAVSKFSDYLRNNLDFLSQSELIPFRRELDHINTYLELEQLRFGEELSVIYDIEADSFLLPVLSVQPLVENAVKHGVSKKRGGGVVTITSRETDAGYLIMVEDTGVGFDPDCVPEDGKTHIGLMNVRERLHKRMNASVEISSVRGEGTTVTVTIPKGEALK